MTPGKQRQKSFLSRSGVKLYSGVVILDTSGIQDPADYGGLLYELKKLGIRDGDSFQIDNGGDLLMYRHAYNRCRRVLRRFGVRTAGKSILELRESLKKRLS